MHRNTPTPVGKVVFNSQGMAASVRAIIEAARNNVALPVRLSNAYCVALAARDTDYKNVLNGPGLTLPDGTPVAWSLQYQTKVPAKHLRARGPSLFTEVLDQTQGTGLRHFFLGTTNETLAELRKAIARSYPGVSISGSYSPPFGPVDSDLIEKCTAEIESSDCDIVWIALGTPKQDFLALALSERVRRPCVGVGAAFDFVAGTVKEAPQWMQNHGLEWLYRLATEPRRLWRRYLIGNIQFLYTLLVDTPRTRTAQAALRRERPRQRG